MLDFEPVSRHQAQAFVSGKPGPRPHDGADHPRVKQVLFQVSGAPAPHDGADHSRVKQRTFMTFPE